MPIKGHYHKSGSAALVEATLHLSDNTFSLLVDEKEVLRGNLDDLEVSNRLGNVQRKITLPDSSVFSTLDNDGVDNAININNGIMHIVNKLESKLHWVVISLVFTVAFLFAFFKWGLPWTSHQVAKLIPHSVSEVIGNSGMKFLDKHFFTQSKLTAEQQQDIKDQFLNQLLPLAQTNKDVQYKLHFREWKMGDKDIPNALALPSGDIVVTDKFIELSKDIDEVNGVLLHEIGHVENRHSLEMLTEGTVISVLIILTVGDVSALADLGVGVATLLISSNYSRKNELEADDFAYKNMLKANKDPASLGKILGRMTEFSEGKKSRKSDSVKPAEPEKDPTSKTTKKDKGVLDYFSSHPSTAKRIALANFYSQCYKEKLTAAQCHAHKHNH